MTANRIKLIDHNNMVVTLDWMNRDEEPLFFTVMDDGNIKIIHVNRKQAFKLARWFAKTVLPDDREGGQDTEQFTPSFEPSGD